MDNVMAVMTALLAHCGPSDEVTLMTVWILMMMTSMIYLLTCGHAGRAHYNDLTAAWLSIYFRLNIFVL